jgi:hypothetical protein
MKQFTKEHEGRLKELSFKMLKNNTVIRKGVTGVDIRDLFHVETESSLRGINTHLLAEIEKKSKVDTWSAGEEHERSLKKIKEQQELVDLLIGYKMNKRTTAEARAARADLRRELDEIKKSTIKPEDRIKEIEEMLKAGPSSEDEDE